MSAPQTNIDKQKRRHRGALLGMAVVVALVAAAFVWWLGYEFDAPAPSVQPDPPSTTEIPPETETLPPQPDPTVPRNTP